MLAHVRVVQLGLGDEASRERLGRFLGQQPAHDWIIGTQPFAHAFKGKRQRQYLEFGIDGNAGEELALNQRKRGIGKFPQSIDVGLGALLAAPHQQACIAKQTAVESGTAFEKCIRQIQHSLQPGSGCNPLPGVRVTEIGARPQFLLSVALADQQRIVIQCIELLAAHLDGILQVVEGRQYDALVGRVAGSELNESAAKLRRPHQRGGQRQVAIELELRPGL